MSRQIVVFVVTNGAVAVPVDLNVIKFVVIAVLVSPTSSAIEFNYRIDACIAGIHDIAERP